MPPLETIENVRAFERFKPAAPAAVHLLLAALLWTTVGGFLLWRGVSAAMALPATGATATLAVGVAIGVLKGWFALRPSARKAAARIRERGDGKCLGGFLSWKSWLFVLAMVGLGKLLRSLALPPWFIGGLLTAVGVALWTGCQVYWSALVRRHGG